MQSSAHVQSCSDVFQTPLCALHPVCQGRGMRERKAGCFLLPVSTGTAPPQKGTGGSPCCTPLLAGCAYGCSTCMDSPTSEKPHCTCGVILQLALKKALKFVIKKLSSCYNYSLRPCQTASFPMTS